MRYRYGAGSVRRSVRRSVSIQTKYRTRRTVRPPLRPLLPETFRKQKYFPVCIQKLRFYSCFARKWGPKKGLQSGIWGLGSRLGVHPRPPVALSSPLLSICIISGWAVSWAASPGLARSHHGPTSYPPTPQSPHSPIVEPRLDRNLSRSRTAGLRHDS